MTGKIDRLCELDDGSWVVIDYKSEASSDYSSVAKEYALSLSVYVEAARQIVGKPVVGKCILLRLGSVLANKKGPSKKLWNATTST